MSDFKIGISRFAQNMHKVHNIPLKFIPRNQLTHKELHLLEKILEPRAWHNCGDTKIYNETLVKITKWSLRTVERTLHSLEKKGLIARIITRGHDRKRIHFKKDPFYTLRVIRCLRVAFVRHYQFKTQKQLGWKTDNRPTLYVDKTGVDPRWFVAESYWFFNYKTLQTVTVEPMWTSYFDITDSNAFVPSVMDLSAILLSDADYGSEEAKMIMGNIRV